MEGFKKGRAWIELDMEALAHNVEALRAIMPAGCRLMPAVKAEAYGHGGLLVARELNRLGVDAFCVASPEEGAALRRGGVTGEMLVLGYTHPELFGLLEEYDLTQTVLSYDYARLMNGWGRPLKCHLAVDTGMHRIGEPCENLDAIEAMMNMENLRVTGIYTHLSADDTADPGDIAFTEEQHRRFLMLLAALRERGYSPTPHILASYGLLNYPEYGGAYARVGIALYGLLSSRLDMNRMAPDLRPVLSIKARVMTVKEVLPGEFVGYGRAYRAEDRRKIAVVAMGYADGLPRALSCGKGRVLISGREAPIIGRVCMDQLIADVTGIEGVQCGDEAVVIGRSGELEITANELAEASGTITNEILSRLGSRLTRTVK